VAAGSHSSSRCLHLSSQCVHARGGSCASCFRWTACHCSARCCDNIFFVIVSYLDLIAYSCPLSNFCCSAISCMPLPLVRLTPYNLLPPTSSLQFTSYFSTPRKRRLLLPGSDTRFDRIHSHFIVVSSLRGAALLFSHRFVIFFSTPIIASYTVAYIPLYNYKQWNHTSFITFELYYLPISDLDVGSMDSSRWTYVLLFHPIKRYQ